MPGADGNNNKMVGNGIKSGEYDHGQAKVVPAVHSNVPSGTKYVQVSTLNKDNLLLAVDVKCHVKDVFGCCCSHLGIQDVRLFGLALRSPAEALGNGDRPRHEYRFIEHSHKLAKYAPKSWRMLAGWGTSPENRPLLVLHFRVRIYVDYVRLIRCPMALLHYYRQLRENLLEQWSNAGCVSEEHCWETVALAVQADKGDNRLGGDEENAHFRPEEYFPLWVINQYGLPYVLRNMPAVHGDLRGLDPTEAMIRFCREASKPPFALNCHLYGLRRNKLDVVDNALFGIATRGLELSDVMADGERMPIKSLLWQKVAKLGFDKRKVTVVGMEGSKMVFYAQSDDKARYLLEFCKSVHQQVIALQADINEARNVEMKERRTFKEAYIYSDGDLVPYDVLVGSTSLPAAGQRRSIVSDASSNTTSGIVSDRQHTHDDSDAERDADVDSSPIVSELSLSGGYHSSMNQSSCEMLIESPPPSLIGYTGGEETESRKDSLGGPCPSDHTITAGSDAEEEVDDDAENKSSPDSPTFRSKISVELAPERRVRSRISVELEQERRIRSRIGEELDQDRRNRNRIAEDQELRNRSRSEPTNVDVRRLDELAKSAEFVIAAELSSLIGSNRSSQSSTIGRTRDQSCGSSSTSKVDISDLRQRTLNGYNLQPSSLGSTSKAVTIAAATNASLATSVDASASTTTDISSAAAPSMSCALDEATQTMERKMTKTLATQTELFDTFDRGTLMSIPSTVPLSDPELQDRERQLFRIVSKQQSFGNQAEVVTVQAPPPPTPKMLNSNLPPYPGRTVSPPDEQFVMGPQTTAVVQPPAHYFVAEQQPQQHSRTRTHQYPLTTALSVEQQREWYRDLDQPTMLPSHQSYSMHDLSALRQPPDYSEAVRQQHNNNNHQHHNHNLNHHSNNKRWTTVSGIDPELLAQIAYSAPYASHHARSEPRLDQVPMLGLLTKSLQQWLAMNEHRPSPHPLMSAPLNGVAIHRTQTTPSGLFVKNQAPIRLAPTGRSGASRGISRVQSMPGHSAAYHFQPMDRTQNSMKTSSTHQINNTPAVTATKEPPSYERALELQAMNQTTQRDEPLTAPSNDVIESPPPVTLRQQEPLHKRHSYGNDSESEQLTTMTARLKNFPMIRALMQENQQHSALMHHQQQHQQHQQAQQHHQQVQQHHQQLQQQYHQQNVMPPTSPFRPMMDDGSGGSRPISWQEQLATQQRLMALTNGGPALYYPPPPPSPLFASRDDRRTHMMMHPMGNAVVSSRCFVSTPNLGPSVVGVVEMPPPPPYNPQSKARNAPRVM